jgi:hypothetical protein
MAKKSCYNCIHSNICSILPVKAEYDRFFIHGNSSLSEQNEILQNTINKICELFAEICSNHVFKH